MDKLFNLSESQKGILYANLALGINTALTTDLWFDGEVNIEISHRASTLLYENIQVLHTVYHQNENGEYTQEFVDRSMPSSSLFTKSFSNYHDYMSWAQNYAEQKLTNTLFEIGIIVMPKKYGVVLKCDHSISDGMTQMLLMFTWKNYYDSLRR